jgi:hypothetical protein
MRDDLIDLSLCVSELEIGRLLLNWRWLCPEPVSLVARNAFGDLFLLDASGKMLWLQVDIGKLTEIASSQSQFLDSLQQKEKREEWLAETDSKAAAERGLQPRVTECVGFKIPVAFAESRDVADNAYLADLYQQVSFLGDLHRQIANTPDGTKVKLRIDNY